MKDPQPAFRFALTRWLSRLLLVLIFHCTCANASLIITLYHRDTIYVAGDSAATSLETGKRSGTVQKVYPFTDNGCVAITGLARCTITNVDGEKLFTMDVAEALKNTTETQRTNSVSLDQKMELIVTAMDGTLNRYYAEVKKLTGHELAPNITMLSFSGYDAKRQFFYLKDCMFDRTNQPKIQAVKEFHGLVDSAWIFFEGEPSFLAAYISGDNPEILRLGSPEFDKNYHRWISTNSMTDSNATSFLLEMYSLHIAHSARLGYSPGYVGPPYDVFKITTNAVTQLVASIPAPANSLASISNPHLEDDEKIEKMMAKLKKSFLENDYSYTFEVMYKPIMDALGGKENLIAMMPELKNQMKQLQIEIIGWETKRPIIYLNGKDRLYAVISCTSEMKLAGQKMKVNDCQLGIKEGKADWQFVSGEKLTPELMEKFFADFPKDFKLPKAEGVIE